MICRIKNFENTDILVGHFTHIVEAVSLIELGQVAASDELLSDVLHLIEIIHCCSSRITDSQGPLFDHPFDRTPDAEEAVSPDR
jgi:hypothetical protein